MMPMRPEFAVKNTDSQAPAKIVRNFSPRGTFDLRSSLLKFLIAVAHVGGVPGGLCNFCGATRASWRVVAMICPWKFNLVWQRAPAWGAHRHGRRGSAGHSATPTTTEHRNTCARAERKHDKARQDLLGYHHDPPK